MHWIDSHTANKNCLQFMSECFDWNVWGSKVSRKTVPCPRSLYGETAVAVIRPGLCNSQSTGVRGSTLAADDRWTWYCHISICTLVHSVSGWTRGVQVKVWDPMRTRAIPAHLRGVFTTRRYTNPRLSLPHQFPLRKNSCYGRDFHMTRQSKEVLDRFRLGILLLLALLVVFLCFMSDYND